MACCPPTEGQCLLTELKALVNQIGSGCESPSPPCCPQPCFPPCTIPFAQVTMNCPPPILAPTSPQPVKPLQLPCFDPPIPPELTPDEEQRSRFDNFYNYYNVDWHSLRPQDHCEPSPPQCPKKRICEDITLRDRCQPEPGCPTGFKPCKMKLTAPPCCDPCGIWFAQVQPCPPKPKKKSNKYEPGPCTRPCCKHWQPKEGPCLYDDPCKAHCFNHPPGMKPSGRFP